MSGKAASVGFVTGRALLGASERAHGKAKPTAEEVAHGVGVGEAAEVGDTIKRQPRFRQKLLHFSDSACRQLIGNGRESQLPKVHVYEAARDAQPLGNVCRTDS